MKIGDFDFLIGADPEMFIIEKATGKLVSAHGMLPGDKEHPFPVEHGAVQVDGMAAEFNINPASTRDEFIHNVQSVIADMQKMIGDKYELVALSTAHFGKKMIDAQPEEAKILGCDPDFSAWTSKVNPVPDAEKPFRTGAGHIHIGWTKGQNPQGKEHFDICAHLIRNLDYYCSPTLLIDRDQERRTLYGKEGAFRPKDYGCEYRTPSNFWVKNEKTIGLMYDLVVHAIRCCVNNRNWVSMDRGKSKAYHEYFRNTYKGKGGMSDYDKMSVLADATGSEEYRQYV